MINIFTAKAAHKAKGRNRSDDDDEDHDHGHDFDRNPDDGPNEPGYGQMMWQIPTAVAGFAFLSYLMMAGLNSRVEKPAPQKPVLELNHR
jgi:hypothetical protein